MILHPGILALLCGSGIALLMLVYAAGLGIKILKGWDFRSSSEEQLILERKTYLVSTIVNYVLGFELFAVFLFVFTVDEIHPLLTGAMCATGSLNANPVGWYALSTQIILFFTSALWLALNHIDGRAEDSPLVKCKFALLLLLVPLVALQFYLQADYFLGLQPEVITSCCGSLFSSTGSGIAAELAGLATKPTMMAFYGSSLLFIGSTILCLRREKSLFIYISALLAIMFSLVSGAALISFISVYYYQLPTHHCPFDLLQKNYGFVGYPLYFSLFGTALFGVLPGFAQPLKKIPSLALEIRRIQVKWLWLALTATVCFLLLASWPVMFGQFRMVDYFQF